MRPWILRAFFILLIWAPIAAWALAYGFKEGYSARLPFFISSNGLISNLQQEFWKEDDSVALPGEVITEWRGSKFDWKTAKADLFRETWGGIISAKVLNKDGIERPVEFRLKRYTKNTFFILFYLPFFLSIIFLGFSVVVASRPASLRKAREVIEVSSLFFLLISVIFLTFLPNVTLGNPYSSSLLLPWVSMLLVHLFLVYPKKKLSRPRRILFLASGYAGVLVFTILRVNLWTSDPLSAWHAVNLPFIAICFLTATLSLSNTIFRSKDFWARRRARLLGLGFVVSFVTGLSAFVALVWETPRISFERILAASLVFPAVFSTIFLKSDVFDLERFFRKGLHQLLLVSMSATLALLVGVGWNEWGIAREQDWLLWVAIAIVVLAFARPVGIAVSESFHKLIRTKVPYPRVNEILESSGQQLSPFLRKLGEHCEKKLSFSEITFRFFQDPTQAWSDNNQQIWRYRAGHLRRVFEIPTQRTSAYWTFMHRGDVKIGRIDFDGGDEIAFDPTTSSEWTEVVRLIARGIEILSLQEFVSLQQGYVAVARMQSLLAHEMKNPLAIIKVCAGLLSNHVHSSEEADELLKTIQDEVRRMSAGIQNVFEHSRKTEKPEKVHLDSIVDEVQALVSARFPDRKLEYTSEQEDLKKQILKVEKDGFRQTLVNLVVNAYEAKSASAQIHLMQTRGSFVLEVRDQGRGILQNADLFKPFSTTKPSGTGLGLVHVKAFMDRHGGSVAVETKAGAGTTFRLEFPLSVLKSTSTLNPG